MPRYRYEGTTPLTVRHLGKLIRFSPGETYTFKKGQLPMMGAGLLAVEEDTTAPRKSAAADAENKPADGTAKNKATRKRAGRQPGGKD